MTDWVSWFRYQLQASGDGFVWAFSQIPSAFYEDVPPHAEYFGSWPATRHLWHVTEYERGIAMPSMKQWLGGSMPSGPAWQEIDSAWEDVQNREPDELIAAFRDVRQQQIALLNQLADVDWNLPQETLWGDKPLSMVVTKTFQHTYEHGDTLLRMGLWLE